MPRSRKITRAFYARDTLTVARELIGMHLVRQVATEANGLPQLVGVEAYYNGAGAPAAPAQETTLSGPKHSANAAAGAT